jgi:hypothetical protein
MNDSYDRAAEAHTAVRPVHDSEPLLRRIHPTQMKEGRASSAAFKDREMSVERSDMLPAPLEALRDHPRYGLARLLTKAARELEQEVVPDPVGLWNLAHALVNGPKPRSTAKKLAGAAELLKAPEAPEQGDDARDDE